ncbi:hypothetical protein GBA52_023508 [Prunus armeniaca]|nr:hypothetical protein GBA52_023508 [Prunus armeniaca]
MMKSCNIVALVGLVLLFMIHLANAAENQGLGASFIFGDSLVDSGNNNYLPTLSKANIVPNGIDFKASGGKPTGRYTNGRTIGDIGQSNYALPYLSPNTTGKSILYGVNYASGGAGILNSTGRIFVNRVGMDIQVDFYNQTRKQIDKVLGPSKAKEYIMKRSIFSITIGSNDFLNNYLLPVLSIGARISETPDAFIDDLISHFRAQLTRLYQLDARKFVIGNVGPLGCIPYQKTINQLNPDECVELPNKLALQYNGRLKDLLAELNDNLPGVSCALAEPGDTNTLNINSPWRGFKTASKACCGNGGQYAGIVPCGPTSSLCSDRSMHVFWDPYHPSEAANLLLAKKLIDGDTRFISPMNLRQLRDH